MATTNFQAFSGDVEVASNLQASNMNANNVTANIATVTQTLTIDGLFKVSNTSVSASVDINATTGSFSERAKLTAGDGAAGDQFGFSVSIDGDTMVIGAPYDDDAGSSSGSAYVFTRDTTGDITSGWTQVAKLTAGDAAASDEFGQSVSIDGDTVVIGAYRDDDDGSASGSVYVFTRNTAGDLASGWTQRAKLTAGDGAAGHEFGVSVSIDGDTVLVGAHWDDDDGWKSGSAYVFTRDTAGDLTSGWTQRAKLTAGDAANDDWFGFSVSIDGDTMVIGAWGNDDAGSVSGSAYVFTRDTAGDLTSGWTEIAKLTASDAAGNDSFGRSVSMDGDTMVIGAQYDDMRGSAYVFTRDTAGSLTSGWTQRAKLTAFDRANYDRFGWSVSISGDTTVIGAYEDDDNGSRSGSAYVYTRTTAGDLTSGFTYVTKLTAGDGAADDFFGESVAISGDTMVIGAYQDDDKGSNSGSAYVFGKLPVLVVKGDVAISGNVGIGTTNPNRLLDVSDTTGETAIQLSGLADQSNAFIYMSETPGRDYGGVLHYSGTGSPQGLRFGHLENSTTPRYDMAIDRTSGKVCIGAYDPYHTLDVTGNFRATDSIGLGGAGNARPLRLTKIVTAVNNYSSVDFFFTNISGGWNPFIIEAYGYSINVSGTTNPISRRLSRMYGVSNGSSSLVIGTNQEDDGFMSVVYTNATKRVRITHTDLRSYSGIYATISSFSGVI